jgi:hypothetical protein
VKPEREGIQRVRRELRSLLIVYLLGILVVALLAQHCAAR